MGWGWGLGLGAAVAQIQYLLRLALNASNTAPLTALTGDTATQVATSSVVVPNQLGTLVTLPATYPAIEGAEYSWDTADGAVLGADVLGGKGSFDDAAYWALSGAEITISGGSLTKTVSGTDKNATKAGILTVGKTYYYEVVISAQGGILYIGGGAVADADARTVTGTFTATNTNLILYFPGATTAVIDTIIIKEITPAILAPSEATATTLSSGLTRYTGNTYGQPGLGVLAEPAATNLCLQSQEFDATWVASNITVDDQVATVVAPDGGAAGATADRLTASADNGTLLQSITSAAATRNFAVYMKRVTGTGAVSLTVDNGATWVEKTLTTSWARYDMTQAAVTNPVIGFKLATNTDAIDVWQADLVSASVATSPILTTTAAVTRAARYTTIAGSELGTDFHVDANVKNLGTEMWFVGDPTSGAGLYKNASDQVVYTDGTDTLTSTTTMTANTPAIIGVHQGTDGATLYVNGTAEATDATMTTPVTWGTTVRLGADTAATAGSVLNGSVTLIHSSNDAIADEVN